jgi:hypothetical protein
MRHQIEDGVHRERVGSRLRELVNFILAFTLPTIAGVGNVQGENHDALLGVGPAG